MRIEINVYNLERVNLLLFYLWNIGIIINIRLRYILCWSDIFDNFEIKELGYIKETCTFLIINLVMYRKGCYVVSFLEGPPPHQFCTWPRVQLI